MTDAFPFNLSADALRHSESYKWAHYGPDVLPLWVADMDFAVSPFILKRLHERLGQTIGYHPLANDSALNKLLRAKFETQGITDLPTSGWIAYLGGVVSGLYAAVAGLTSPGEEVITFTPIYPPFLSAITDNGRVPKHVPLVQRDDGWHIDFDALESAVTPATRLLMLCNPHNPTGRVWTRDELRRLADFVKRHRLWCITDELHADLTLTGEFTPFTAVADAEVRKRTVTVTGPCKTYNTAGLGIGAIVGHHPPLVNRLKKTLNGIAAHPAALAVTMWQAALEDDGQWLAGVLEQLRSNRDFLLKFIDEKLPGVVCHAPQATYLAWLDYRQHPKATEMHQHLLKTAKVALNPGAWFGPGFEGYLRLNFATSLAILSEALERMAKAHSEKPE